MSSETTPLLPESNTHGRGVPEDGSGVPEDGSGVPEDGIPTLPPAHDGAHRTLVLLFDGTGDT